MKKLNKGKGPRVHPAPSSPTVGMAAWGHLMALPTVLLALMVTLAPEEQEVLSYLLTGDGVGVGGWKWKQHPPKLGCGCFRCYKSFWVRWDASPNRHIIHWIIEAVEAGAGTKERGRRGGSRRRRRSSPKVGGLVVPQEAGLVAGGSSAGEVEDGREKNEQGINGGASNSNRGGDIDARNPLRRLVSFIREGVW